MASFPSFVPPGIVYLLVRLPKLSVLPISLYLSLILAKDVLHVHIPTSLVILASVLILPLALAVSVNWTKYKNNRDAAARGAIVVPQVPSNSIGSTDVLAHIKKNIGKGYIAEGISKWSRKIGHTFRIYTLFDSRIFTTEPEYIKMVLASKFEDYEKGHGFRDYMKVLLGDGVFNADGDMWKFHRSMTRPFFTHDKISHFDIFDRNADDVIGQIRIRLKQGIAVDIQDAAGRFSLDSSSEFLFGTNVSSLSAGLLYPQTVSSVYQNKDHPSNEFAESFKIAQSKVASRSRFGANWPLNEFWKDEVKEQMKTVYKFVDPIIASVLEKKKSSEKNNANDEVTLLDHLVKITDDPIILRDEALNMLVAGRDTTAALITFAIYVLAEHPKVLERLRQEILENLGQSGRPSSEDLRNMKYLRAVLNETLRLYPPVPINTRTTKNAVVWPSVNGGPSYYIPANTRLHYSVFVMHRRTDLWGPDALEFDPDRFLDYRVHKYLTPNPFIFLPFNAGPRICVGQQFAYNEASFMLVRLLQAFKSITIDMDAHPDSRPPLEWATGEGRQPLEKVWLKSHLTMFAADGVWVKMEEA